MKKETIHDYVRRRLRELLRMHSRIASECGISQASISRLHLGIGSPTLATIQPVLDWLDRYDKEQRRSKVRSRRIPARAAAALGQ